MTPDFDCVIARQFFFAIAAVERIPQRHWLLTDIFQSFSCFFGGTTIVRRYLGNQDQVVSTTPGLCTQITRDHRKFVRPPSCADCEVAVNYLS